MNKTKYVPGSRSRADCEIVPGVFVGVGSGWMCDSIRIPSTSSASAIDTLSSSWRERSFAIIIARHREVVFFLSPDYIGWTNVGRVWRIVVV